MMSYKDLKSFLIPDNPDLVTKIFKDGSFSFSENLVLDLLSNYDSREKEEYKDYYIKLGCIILNNNTQDVILPRGTKVNIKPPRPSDSSTMTECYIENNGTNTCLNYIDESIIVDYELTSFGEKLVQFGKNYNFNLVNAYKCISSIEDLFGVKIIND